jgi:hypothetical protein
MNDVLISSVSSTSFHWPVCADLIKSQDGTTQTKSFIHDVNQQVGQAQRPERNTIGSTGNLPGNRNSQSVLGDGGDRRDRTDDLKLAKLPLYQLSYVPGTLHPRRGGYFRIANYGGPGKT